MATREQIENYMAATGLDEWSAEREIEAHEKAERIEEIERYHCDNLFTEEKDGTTIKLRNLIGFIKSEVIPMVAERQYREENPE